MKILPALVLFLAPAAYAEQFTVRDGFAFLIRIFGGVNLQAFDSLDLGLILIFVLVIAAFLLAATLGFLSLLFGIIKKAG